MSQYRVGFMGLFPFRTQTYLWNSLKKRLGASEAQVCSPETHRVNPAARNLLCGTLRLYLCMLQQHSKIKNASNCSLALSKGDSKLFLHLLFDRGAQLLMKQRYLPRLQKAVMKAAFVKTESLSDCIYFPFLGRFLKLHKATLCGHTKRLQEVSNVLLCALS